MATDRGSGPVEAAPEGGVVSEVGRTGEGREPNNDTTPTTADRRFDAITVRDNGVEITEAPEFALVTLALVAAADHRALRVYDGDKLILGTGPGSRTYRVIGWNADRYALEVQRID